MSGLPEATHPESVQIEVSGLSACIAPPRDLNGRSWHGVDTLHQKPSSVLPAGFAGVSLAERARGEDLILIVQETLHETINIAPKVTQHLGLGGGSSSFQPPYWAPAKNRQ